MIQALTVKKRQISIEQIFMLTMFVVNAGNYAYNLLLGRFLGPTAFADAALLVTFLLVLSFVGMTFQIVTTKYCVLFENDMKKKFISVISITATACGLAIGLLFIVFSKNLQTLLHTETDTMFQLFGIGIPIYFMMSVNRGIYQGENKLLHLSFTYVTEMFARLFITSIFVLFAPQLPTTVLVAAGITLSLVFGLFPLQKTFFQKPTLEKKLLIDTKPIATFFALTAFYELTQIIINNSDVILVKHFFDNHQAGFYASLALIGRVVYFVTWIFVMLLLPKVIQHKKEGKDTQPLLMKYVSLITLFSSTIVLITYIMPETVVYLMFGEEYLSIAPLLWKYALATALFAVANVFSYYFLSISNYLPVVLSALLGFTQIGLIVLFHSSLEQVVHMQIIAMAILLVFQLLFFVYQHKKNVRLQ